MDKSAYGVGEVIYICKGSNLIRNKNKDEETTVRSQPLP